MIKVLFRIVIHFLLFSSLISATTINGRFLILDKTNSNVSILLQLNTNTGSDDLGGATFIIEFDSTLINISESLQRNIDYYFHNFSGGNYSLGTVTRPKANMVWINIDLPYNKSNDGTTISENPDWTDMVTINFDLVNSSDSVSISWLTSSTFWGIYDGNNTDLWNIGQFQNFNEKIIFDTTPPELLDAALIDLTTLELTYSEPVDSISGTYLSNYSISNNINIQSAFISNYKDVVTLITDNHISGMTYTILAENIYDLAGNLIGNQNNTREYICVTDSISPEITEVIVQNNKTITVNFSERVEYNSAANKNNYTISNNIEVNSVQVLPDSSGAMLKTSRQSNNSEYALTVINIKDRAGNNINPNPSSRSYNTPNKGKGNSKKNSIQMAKSNSWFQYYTPDMTIDEKGMTYPYSRWQSGETLPIDIIFDLGKKKSFDSLRISFHKWEAGKLFKYSVYTSIDSVIWTPAIEEIWSEDSEWTELNIDSIETRYMKLLILESNQGPFASIWEVEMYGTDKSSSGEEITTIPNTFELYQNYPNPFNPSTRIRYSIPDQSIVVIKVFDLIGNEIETLVSEGKQAGTYDITWNAQNLSSGVYFYQLMAGEFVETKKMLLMK